MAPIITAYRKAIDAYFEDPVNYSTNLTQLRAILKSRVREYTTAHTFSNPGLQGVDTSGSREPRFFSYDSGDAVLTVDHSIEPSPLKSVPELIVHLSGSNAAEAAVEAGADAIYFNSNGFVRHNGKLQLQWLSDFVNRFSGENMRVAVLMPNICDRRDMTQWQPYLQQLSRIKNLAIGVSNLGGIYLVRKLKIKNIIADFPLNITNSIAADELSTMGTDRITASVELSFEQLKEFAEESRMPIELIGQGPLAAMLLEHCVIAAASGITSYDMCPMPCRQDAYAMRDAADHDFPLEPDKRCRNHIFTASDVCVLPNLSKIMSLNVAALRIEAHLDNSSTVETVTSVYRNAIDSLKEGRVVDIAAGLEVIKTATGRPLSDGPFNFESILEPVKEQHVAES
jgi:putative protease